MFNEGNQIHNLISSSGSGTVINYGSGSDFLTSSGSGYGSGSGSTTLDLREETVPIYFCSFIRPLLILWYDSFPLYLNSNSRRKLTF